MRPAVKGRCVGRELQEHARKRLQRGFATCQAQVLGRGKYAAIGAQHYALLSSQAKGVAHSALGEHGRARARSRRTAWALASTLTFIGVCHGQQNC